MTCKAAQMLKIVTRIQDGALSRYCGGFRTGLSAWFMPRPKSSSESRSAAVPLQAILLRMLRGVRKQLRRRTVSRRKVRVTPTPPQVTNLAGRISPFCQREEEMGTGIRGEQVTY